MYSIFMWILQAAQLINTIWYVITYLRDLLKLQTPCCPYKMPLSFLGIHSPNIKATPYSMPICLSAVHSHMAKMLFTKNKGERFNTQNSLQFFKPLVLDWRSTQKHVSQPVTSWLIKLHELVASAVSSWLFNDIHTVHDMMLKDTTKNAWK